MNHINSNNVSLELAARLTAKVNEAWESGAMLESVTPVTRDLLRFWFSEEHCSLRVKNFHAGQRQAILNIIYLHEVLGVRSVLDNYEKVSADLLQFADLGQLGKEKYQMPKYAVKMATGTGKTWVMHALLLWQMLNARHAQRFGSNDGDDRRFTQKFLIVAPGLIVYDRLLDAFCGRIERGKDTRDIQTNDYYLNQEVFIPLHYRDEVFSFIQNNVVTKEDGIGRKTTGEGLIALTNWHLFENQIAEERTEGEGEGELTPPEIIEQLLPVRPGKAAGNELGALDRRFLRGNEIEYLAGLKDLMVINDEAHHIHEVKRGGEVEEVEWQKGLNEIARGKDDHFVQVDFSATPYDTSGTAGNVRKMYFPHIVVDFDLATAMTQGLVKTLLLDHRQELTELENLDFRAVRNERNQVVALSDGQRMMIRAGLSKLRILEKDFTEVDETKNPKMLIMCEDTSVSPFVTDFLKEEGVADEDVVMIDSTSKGEVKEAEWKEIKARLFDIDRYRHPKIIVSVLMLREGFDVNNICVIIPLRSSQAPILLEQTIGRGLRLMWREPEYKDIKDYDRKMVLVKKKPPKTYIDMLSIVEHPAFRQFYDELINDGLAGVDEGDVGSDGSVGDIIRVGLKENYAEYDFDWPIIMREAEEELSELEIDPNELRPFTMFPLDQLRRFLVSDGETFVSQEITSKTQFGAYKVTGDLFRANNYNEYLQKLLRTVTTRFDRISSHKEVHVPNIQVNEAVTVRAIDIYIRTRLFSGAFNPFEGNDWKILLAKDGIVTKHIVEEVARAIYRLQQQVTTTDAIVEHIPFSKVKELKMRESFSRPFQKTIYERLGWPSHGGGFEQAFMQFLDDQGEVERFLKINETQHTFATIYYIRADGLMATYHPDFIVGTADRIYLVETKGNDRVNDKNVRQKQIATTEWVRKINELPACERMDRVWEYVLLSEDNFYLLAENGATLTDICQRCKVSASAAQGTLFA